MDRTLAVLALGLVGCGSSEPDQVQPDRRVRGPGVEVQLPAGVDASKVKLSVAEQLPPDLVRFASSIDQGFNLLHVIQIAPKTTLFPAPATMAVEVTKCPNPLAVELVPEGLATVLASRPNARGIEVTVPRAGAIAMVCPRDKLVGSPTQLLRGVPELLMQENCSGYVTPDAPAIKAIAGDPKRFAIDPDGAIHLDAKLELRSLDEAGELAKADQVLARGGGDRVSLGVVYASLLAARGYPVMLVGGAVSSAQSKGVTMWVVAVRGDKPEYVDLGDAAHPRLIPLVEATKREGLQIHRGCAWYPPNALNDPTQFSIDPKSQPGAPDVATVLEHRRQLDKQCNHGADKPACMERGTVDDQLRKQLDTMLAQHKELDAKCKVGKDAAACTERDRLAGQGKAIKAIVDAKP